MDLLKTFRCQHCHKIMWREHRKCSVENHFKTTNMVNVVCIGEDAENSFVGKLHCPFEIKIGQTHKIKNQLWRVDKIGQNYKGETVVDFRPAQTITV